MQHVVKRARLESAPIVSTMQKAYLDVIEGTRVVSQCPDDGVLTVGTHDGSFHCDEALAISMLKFLPAYEDAVVVRTRNPEWLKQCNTVVDVGAVYDAENRRYDHHQREFDGVLDGYSTKLSSAGLLYKHYGRDIIRSILTKSECPDDDKLVEVCFHKVYKGFVEHIDAIDNGIEVAEAPLRYNISTTLSSRVGNLNPRWNEDSSAEVYNRRFTNAMILTGTEFLEKVQYLAEAWWPARAIVDRCLQSRFEVHPSGSVVILDHFCPWKEHLFELEEEMGAAGNVLYVLYADSGGSWRVQAVPDSPSSFASRKKLPEVWRGVRDSALSDLVGCPGAIFVHAAGFIGGHSTREGALSMAVQALRMK